MTERVYLDWNATAPLRPEARRAFVDALAVAGNPSSVHAEGRAARRLIEAAREQVAALVSARPADVFFTSGGTEANMLALSPAIETAGEKRPREVLFISAIEHSSVRAGGRFRRKVIREVPVDAEGRVDLAALAAAVSDAERPLVSLMLANNETGVVQPVVQAVAQRQPAAYPARSLSSELIFSPSRRTRLAVPRASARWYGSARTFTSPIP